MMSSRYIVGRQTVRRQTVRRQTVRGQTVLVPIWNTCVLAWIYSCEFLSYQIQIFLLSFDHPSSTVSSLLCWLAVCCNCQLIQGDTCGLELCGIWNVCVLAGMYSCEFLFYQIQFFFLFPSGHPGLMVKPLLN